MNDWNYHFTAALNEWTNQGNVVIYEVEPGNDSFELRYECPPIEGKVRICNSDYGQTGWLGIASWWTNDDGYITQATVKMNDRHIYEPIELRHLLCHELGHPLGLGHPSIDGSSQATCMGKLKKVFFCFFGASKLLPSLIGSTHK